MGRRAKNKQADPEPLADVNGPPTRPSAKKLGKRKAEAEDDVRESASKRPAKKLKEAAAKKGDKKGQAKKDDKKKPKGMAGKKKKQETEDEDEGDEDEVMQGGSSDGWEDVEDGLDVKAEAKCV